MNRHAGILQLRVEPATVDGNEVEPLEWIGSEANRGEKENEDDRQRAGDVGHQLAIARAIRVKRDRRIDRKNEGPEQQRSRLSAPERSDRINRGQIRAGERCDVLDGEV